MATPVIAQGVDSVPFKVACAVSKVTSREDCAAADAAPDFEKNQKGVKMKTCPLSEDRYFHFRQLLQDRETVLTAIEVDQRSSAFVAGSFQRVAGDRKKRSFQIEKRDVHQPQYESLVEHVSDRLDPDGGPIIVVELGAGKGLFGRLLRERLAEQNTNGRCTFYVAIDRRNVTIHFDDDDGEDKKNLNHCPPAGKSSNIHAGIGTPGHELASDLLTSTTASIRIAADVRSCNLHNILNKALFEAEENGRLHAKSEGKSRVIVVAKHFCASATDAAVDCIRQAISKLNKQPEPDQKYVFEQIVVAPCCHPQIVYEDYANVPWLKESGINCTKDLDSLKQLLVMSKCRTGMGIMRRGYKNEGHQNHHMDDPVEAFRLGRLSRRLIEEGRLQSLKSMFGDSMSHSSIIEYVPISVTPDNLLLLLHRSADTGVNKMSQDDDGLITGIHLSLRIHLSARKDSLQYRIMQYLLERQREERPGWDVVDTINVQWLEQRERPSILIKCKKDCNDISLLLRDLDSDELLLQNQVLLYPFSDSVKSLQAAGAWVRGMADHRRDELYPTRVQCFPRSDESRFMPYICKIGECGMDVSCERLSPVDYRSVVTCVKKRNHEKKDDIEYHVGITVRGEGVDPRDRAARGQERWSYAPLRVSIDEARHRKMFRETKGDCLLVCKEKQRAELSKYLQDFCGKVTPAFLKSAGDRPEHPWNLHFLDENNVDAETKYSLAAIDTYEMIEQMEQALLEIKSKMAPGGVVLMSLRLSDLASASKTRLHRRQLAAARFLISIFPYDSRDANGGEDSGCLNIEHLTTDKEIGRFVMVEMPR
jgi:hypothetical protein